jgi:hypothetical protein
MKSEFPIYFLFSYRVFNGTSHHPLSSFHPCFVELALRFPILFLSILPSKQSKNAWGLVENGKKRCFPSSSLFFPPGHFIQEGQIQPGHGIAWWDLTYRHTESVGFLRINSFRISDQ